METHLPGNKRKGGDYLTRVTFFFNAHQQQTLHDNLYLNNNSARYIFLLPLKASKPLLHLFDRYEHGSLKTSHILPRVIASKS